MQRILQTKANTMGKSWTHAEVQHTRGPDFTSLYLANTGGGGSWVKGKRVWSGSGERGKPILGFLLRLFWGKCPTGMTYRQKEVRMSWNHQVHAIMDGERESTHTITGKSAMAKKRTKQPSLSDDREWHGQHRQVVLAERLTNQWWSAKTPKPDKGS